MSQGCPKLIVYFDGSCPLCEAEMSYYKMQDAAEKMQFVDISVEEQSLPQDLNRQAAMSRLHVRKPNGELIVGAASFVSIWKALPRWNWAARMAALPGMMSILEFGYRLFLKGRPAFSALFRKLKKRTRADAPV